MLIITGKDHEVVAITLKGGPIIISAGQTVYTDAIFCPDHKDIALSYKNKCDGIPNITIEMEQSHLEPKENEEDEDCVVADNDKPICKGVTDKKRHHCSITHLPLKCFRFKIQQESTTAPDAEIELIVSCK